MAEAVKSDMFLFFPYRLREVNAEFSEENFLGETLLGKFYRGMTSNGANLRDAQPVTVKILDDSAFNFADPLGKGSILKDEVSFLQRARIHGHQRNLPKPIGCINNSKCLGIVYDLNPRDTLHNLILKDNFTWLQRIKVALQVARMLVLFPSYCPPLVVFKISAAQVLVDEDCNPVLCDFGMLVDGPFSNARGSSNGQFDRASGNLDLQLLTAGGCSGVPDAFSFGILLLSLIAKKVSDISDQDSSVVLWAKDYCKRPTTWFLMERNLKHVHKIFKEDPDYNVYDAHRILRLGMHCIEFSPEDRPTMKETLESLQALHVCQCKGMVEGGLSEVVEFLPKQLGDYTAGFHDQNFLSNTQFAKLYRGKMDEACVTVKAWDDSRCNGSYPLDKLSKLTEEFYLLRHPSINGFQQNLPKPLGYCRNFERPGIVYDLNPRDTLHNLILDDKFTWLQRIKVALQLAHLLVFFHNYDPPFIVRNISPANIVVDQDNKPVLVDLGMLLGGLFGNARDIPNPKLYVPGYTDVHFFTHGCWSVACDVFSFGILLLCLIVKRLFDVTDPKTCLLAFAKGHCEIKMTQEIIHKNVGLVHEIFKDHPGYVHADAVEVAKLALSCVEFDPLDRPIMKEALERLQALNAVQCQSRELGI